MPKIQSIQAREILASGGAPSVEVTVALDDGSLGEDSVSYGASAGSKEAFVLLDGDTERYNGKGMLKAVSNVNEKIAQLLVGQDALNQRQIDEIMINADGTGNKSNLGANAILAVSMATARAAANSSRIELYQHLANTFNFTLSTLHLPKPLAVFIEGGVHADNSTDLQEYALAVTKEQPAKENVRMMEEIYQATKSILHEKGYPVNVGNEGAFAPEGIKSNEAPLEIIAKAIGKAGYGTSDAGIYIDAAASEFFKDGKYILAAENLSLDANAMVTRYQQWMQKYPLIALEDGLSEFDWEHWPILMSKAGNVKIVADDLTVTNVKLWQKAIDQKCANAILIKLNQAGTVTETMDCCLLAKKYNLTTIPSHRGGGETNDDFLVDLAVATGSEWIKVGPTRGERLAKYNRLMRIEEKILGT